MSKMEEKMSAKQDGLLQSLYDHYEYLAPIYSQKLYKGLKNLNYTRDDIEQELKIKIYTIIRDFIIKRMVKKIETDKPMNLLNYISSSCSRALVDLIRKDNQVGIKSDIVDVCEYDFVNYTEFDDFNDTSFLNGGNKVVLNGVDVLAGLNEQEQEIVKLFLKGYKYREIVEIYDDLPIEPRAIIVRQRKYWMKNKDQMTSFRNHKFSCVAKSLNSV